MLELQKFDYIEHELKKFNETDAAIAQIAKDFLAMKIENSSDKEGYILVKSARLHVKGLRVALEKRRKESTADALAFKKAIDGEAARLKDLIEPIESHLIKEEEAYNAAHELLKKQHEEFLHNQYMERIKILKDLAFTFDGLVYHCEYHEFKPSIENLKSVSDEQWQSFVTMIEPKYKTHLTFKEQEKFKREAEEAGHKTALIAIEKKRVEEQRLIDEQRTKEKKDQEEAAEALKIEREKFEAEKAEFDRRKELETKNKFLLEHGEEAAKASGKKLNDLIIDAIKEKSNDLEIENERPTIIIREDQIKIEDQLSENITISIEEYEELKDDQQCLFALQAAGIDNWEGYEFAMESYRQIRDLCK
jgi:hypothetical protein